MEHLLRNKISVKSETSVPENESFKIRALARLFLKRIGSFKVIIFSYSLILALSGITYLAENFFHGFVRLLSSSLETPWGIVTSLFVHAGEQHLIDNLRGLSIFLFLFIFTNLHLSETRLKMRVFFSSLLIFASALLSNAVSILLMPDIAAVGASGLVYALIGVTLGFSLSNAVELLKSPDALETEDIEGTSGLETESMKNRFLQTFRYAFLLVNMIFIVFFFVIFLRSPQQFLNVNPGVNSLVHALAFFVSLVTVFFYTSKNWFNSRQQKTSARLKDRPESVLTLSVGTDWKLPESFAEGFSFSFKDKLVEFVTESRFFSQDFQYV